MASESRTSRSGWGRLIGYVLFAVVVFVVALAATFPVQQVMQRVAAEAAERSGWELTVKGGVWDPPTGLYFDALSGTPPGGEPLTVRDVHLKFAPLRLKDRVLAVDHDLSGLGGRLSGHLEMGDDGDGRVGSWNGTLDGLALDRLPRFPAAVSKSPWVRDYSLDGVLSGDARAAWRDNQFARGNGETGFTIKGLQVNLPKAPVGALNLPLGDLTVQADWQRGRVELSEVTLTGSVVEGSGSGRILLGRTPQLTRVDLRFSGTLGQAFPMRGMVVGLLKSGEAPVTITVKGSLANPMLYINGKTVDRLLVGG